MININIYDPSVDIKELFINFLKYGMSSHHSGIFHFSREEKYCSNFNDFSVFLWIYDSSKQDEKGYNVDDPYYTELIRRQITLLLKAWVELGYLIVSYRTNSEDIYSINKKVFDLVP